VLPHASVLLGRLRDVEIGVDEVCLPADLDAQPIDAFLQPPGEIRLARVAYPLPCASKQPILSRRIASAACVDACSDLPGRDVAPKQYLRTRLLTGTRPGVWAGHGAPSAISTCFRTT
jgi:hypothetical protein